MTITMEDSKLCSIRELKKFLKSSQKLEFNREDRKESYIWIENTLVKFRYLQLGKKKKGIVQQYLGKVTGYSHAQITRLIAQHRETGYIREKTYKRHKFARKYLFADIKLLAKTDEVHDYPNGAALKKVLSRMTTIYEKQEYENISQISVGHIYNLRKSVSYRRVTKRYTKTKPSVVNIGQRKKPEPNGVPGYIRVDTVHQGDREGEKGVYHINTVDEVTQFEFIGAVERINEHYLAPLLGKLIENYPFKLIEFHSDNGSEYINKVVVRLLNKLTIDLTKSRPRHTNDNALIETKNGCVIRKWIGYQFIEQKYAYEINKFYFGCFNEYLNFHRPCGYASECKDKKGKVKKVYFHHNYMTPYEKLKSIPDSTRYLKKEITFEMLDKIAYSKTDNEMARTVQKQRCGLFEKISPVRDSKLFQAHSLI